MYKKKGWVIERGKKGARFVRGLLGGPTKNG
jgi:hypothetical protein